MNRQPKFTDVVMSEDLVPAVLKKTVFCITSNLDVLCLPSLHCVYTKASSIFIEHPLNADNFLLLDKYSLRRLHFSLANSPSGNRFLAEH